MGDMPEFMKKFHEELMSTEVPPEWLKKEIYLLEWLKWFDEDVAKQYCLSKEWGYDSEFMKFSKSILRDGFLWTRANFAELDLGGNSAWYGAALKVMKKMKSKKWDITSEKIFKIEWINTTDRRW